MICFFHSADLDGHCSGAIVKIAANILNKECRMVGIDYGEPFPWDSVNGEDVMMVDFSLQPFEDMVKLNKAAKSFIWIDHHISAMKEYDKSGEIIGGIRNDKLAACELAWQFCMPLTDMPRAVRLLGRYDVWDHSSPAVLPFQYGARLYSTNPEVEDNIEIWRKWICEFPAHILEEGEKSLQRIKESNAKYVKSCAFETKLDGLKCIAVNKVGANSQLFESVYDENKYDAMLAFGYKNNQWTVSLYATKPNIDVSMIAKNRGGGGHKQAAGFQCVELPFELNTIKKTCKN